MLKIKNDTALSYQLIGWIIDDILRRSEGTTNYVGKWNYYEYELYGKKFKIETLQLKNDFKVYIKEK